MKSIVKVLGMKRTEGVIEGSGVEYKGWNLHMCVPSEDPDFIGSEVIKKFFSDKVLNDVLPSPGDKLVVYQNFEGKLLKVEPFIENLKK